MIYYEKFQNVMQQTENVALTQTTHNSVGALIRCDGAHVGPGHTIKSIMGHTLTLLLECLPGLLVYSMCMYSWALSKGLLLGRLTNQPIKGTTP